MKKVKVKIPAKINITLDVLGVSEGFHQIKSLVTSIALYDTVTVYKRKDYKVTLTERKVKAGCLLENNVAYKSAKLFMKKFNTLGVDIVIDKTIPVGGGLGGSSADIAGVLLAMKKLFNVSGEIEDLASQLGSDSVYMLGGGFAIIEGKGDKVTKLNYRNNLPLLLITQDKQVSAKDSYIAYDKLGHCFSPCTDQAIKSLFNGSLEEFYKVIKNDLQPGSITLLDSIEKNLKALKDTEAKAVIMTGSGSTVFAIYKNKKTRNGAYKKLVNNYGKNLIKASTINKI